jgi:hypothetical protein
VFFELECVRPLRDVFLDPAERSLSPDWERATVGLVTGFGESVGTGLTACPAMACIASTKGTCTTQLSLSAK